MPLSTHSCRVRHVKFILRLDFNFYFLVFFFFLKYRKDSFITHRAFCDALAEESSRITTTTVGANSFNFRNDHLNNNLINSQPNHNNLQHGFSNSAGIHHLSGTYRPDFAGMSTGNTLLGDHHHQQQKPRLSLWLDHQTNSHQLNPDNLFMPSDMIQMASNNLYGPNSSIGNYANLSLSPLPPQQGMKEEPIVSNKGNLADSLTSLYSDNQNHSPPPPMSATALLQKAAQMGSTQSNPNFFGNSVGVMNSSSPSSSSNNRSELHQVFGKQQPENPADGMVGFSSPMMNSNNNNNQCMNLHSGLHGMEHSLTRDFLGMGSGEGGAGGPFLPQELAKFASMSSAMGLSHFTSNH